MKTWMKTSIAALLVVIAVAAALLTYQSEKERMQEPVQEPVPELVVQPQPESAAEATTRSVKVFFFRPSVTNPGKVDLGSSTEEVLHQSNPTARALSLARAALARSGALVGPRAGVEQVFLLEDGTAIVDLARQTAGQLRGSVACELGLLRSIARSLTTNLEEVEGVRFILGGQEAKTLAGHVSLSTVFR